MIYLLRTIPLSKKTRDAWRSSGVTIIPRSVTVSHDGLRNYLLERDSSDYLVNLGRSDSHLDSIIDACGITCINHPSVVRSVKTPAALRKTLGDLIPPEPSLKDCFWHKGPGQHGQSKSFYDGGMIPANPPGFDNQKHIVGDEYRVLTVGRKVVQAFRKVKGADTGFDFDWSWVGVNGIKSANIIPKLHKAIDALDNGNHTMFGWDVITNSERAYIIEANSSPGVNEYSAQRIVKEIECLTTA